MIYYRNLLRQASRIEPFRRALKAMVTSTDRVLEVGAGVGTYSFFAADAGASRVWAVEGEPVLHVAETVARLNGNDGRIEFVRGWVPEVTLPERATFLIFEDFPTRLVDSETFRLFAALRDRYLTSDSRYLPNRARLMAAPAREKPGFVPSLEPLGKGDDSLYGIDWSATREYVVNTVHQVTIPPDAVVGEPQVFADVTFGELGSAEDFCGSATWSFNREETIGGMAYWFDLELLPGDWISNAPGVLSSAWGQMFLPLDPPLSVPAGETLTASIGPDRQRDGAPGLLAWRAFACGSEARGHEFASMPASFADLYGRSPDGVPTLCEMGRMEARTLCLADGNRSVRDIALELCGEFAELEENAAISLVVNALAGRTQRGRVPQQGLDRGRQQRKTVT